MAALSLAQAARGFVSISSFSAVIGLRVRISRVFVLPHWQTGSPGGQMQDAASYLKNCLTMRSSSEWKEMTAMTPPGERSSKAVLSALESSSSSWLTAILRA